MRVRFLVEGSPEIGGGHVMRSLTLARALHASGDHGAFSASPDHVPFVRHVLKNEFEVSEKISDFDEVDVLVVDGYGIDPAVGTQARRHGTRVLVLEDAPARPRDCDILCDPTPGRAARDYLGFVPSDATVLTGGDYALLRPEFGELRRTLPDRAGKVERLFLSFGLTDFGAWALPVARALAEALPDVMIDVAIGSAAPSLKPLMALADASARVACHVDTRDVAQLMASADLAVGSAGGTTWERACLGLPSVVAIVAENQRDNAAALSRAGAAIVADDQDSMIAAVVKLQADADARQAMRRSAMALCDGQGANRLADMLRTSAADRPKVRHDAPLRLRTAADQDRANIWFWRNDPDSRHLQGSADPIPWTDHCGWWTRVLQDDRCTLFIGERDGRAIGQVRFDQRDDGVATVSIAVNPACRGTGQALPLLKAAVARFAGAQGTQRLQAMIHESNDASLRLFSRAGFEIVGRDSPFVICEFEPAQNGTQE
ncbi:UDP-2,4-diacetamido-2,4,6-trideoxy-beta-L-altropyranose hydrolase [Oceanomicrobium pacificus]|uniref:UDP-2,4-diacetamido-2,4, 6-trideoxy-beta-L-altropyranose hydrolase n=1 Tax=Oceanomicrobium pacificus TaxID=2692916 RepID=A0A6B0TYW9_9RHOB|nr:UDP-2,4-diacetamido-2,4,6-trideoxy-beta-L-altropyranose hydrolase [Oceanomicrobium pacificus]MXU66608.1 UDP-2,4-diacetamido-2,4,6-trideoxy-beta-L-altropyranose hydrolase [Oceanomicrobium pacificus]